MLVPRTPPKTPTSPQPRLSGKIRTMLGRAGAGCAEITATLVPVQISSAAIKKVAGDVSLGLIGHVLPFGTSEVRAFSSSVLRFRRSAHRERRHGSTERPK